MGSQIKVKIGAVEIEYEGDEKVGKQELLELLNRASEISREYHSVSGRSTPADPGAQPGVAAPNQGTRTGTPQGFAAKLRARNGPDVILAAAAYLTVVEGEETFTQRQLGDEIKTAAGFYKEAMSKNLSKNLQRMVKSGELSPHGKGKFALTATTRKSLEAKLAD